jgi:hypothetical protein
MRILQLLMAMLPLVLAFAQAPATQPWRYELIEGSTLADDCLICGRPTIIHPMRGTFEMHLETIGPLTSTYRLTNIQFRTGPKSAPVHTVTGSGTFSMGGQLAVQQSMTLVTEICDVTPACRDVTLTNDDRGVRVTFPLIDISLTQSQENLLSVYKMRIVAAPIREIWFMVTNEFTPANGGPVVRAGDILEPSGRTVRTKNWLLESNGVQNPPPALRLDALDVAPGGDLLFSTAAPNVTALREGDLLSWRGGVRRTNQQLLLSFGIKPVIPDVGLDAVHVTDAGEILFSIRTNIFSEGLGATLRHGDVLSDKGNVLRNNEQLLSRFHPINPGGDYGLDALYVWPNGEMWFSTTAGFQDQQLGEISDGDLLSTEGIIVFRNAELLAAWGTPEPDSNFGLGDIFVVTDVAAGPAPRMSLPHLSGNDVWIHWTGTNRVFQVEQAATITGPWQSIGFIDPADFLREPGGAAFAQRFFRLRAW